MNTLRPNVENVVEIIHEVRVEDPYRWLEDDVRENAEVKQWVEAENVITREYLDSIEALPTIRTELTRAWNYPMHKQPFHRGKRWFQSRNTGLQNHNVIYTGDSPTNISEVVLNPNLFSKDGTRALSMVSPSPKGTYLTWGISEGESDWSTWYCKNLETGKKLQEVLVDIKKRFTLLDS